MIDAAGEWIAHHRAELGLSLRITVAGLLAFAVGHLVGLVQLYWAVLTAIIVMQASVGGSLKATADRLIGTVAGAGWGVLVTLTVPHAGAMATAGALVLALVPLVVLVALSPGYRLAPVTTAIVLLGPAGPADAPEAALDRVVEIAIGCVVALAVALATTASRAHRLLGAAASDGLAAMREQIELLLAGVGEPVDGAAVLVLHDRIRAAVERAAAIAGEAVRERSSYLTDAPDPDPLVRSMRRLSHDLVMIARALPAPLPEPVRGRLAAPARTVVAAVAGFLGATGEVLTRRAPRPPSLAPVDDALAQFATALAGLRRDRLIAPLPAADAERVFGLAFALQQMGRNLDELAGRAGEMIRTGPSRAIWPPQNKIDGR